MIDVRDFQPDGRHLPIIKPHSLEKLRVHNYYAEVFAGGMSKQWSNLVYVGLYSGAGAASVEGENRTVMTSALSVLTQPIPFTKYIFVDEDRDCLDALQQRVGDVGASSKCTFIHSDVNASADQVLAALPDWKTEGGVLTFCFIDPFKLDLSFEVLRRLSHLRIDILLMIPLGYDLKRNWREYLERPEMRDRLTAFLGDDDWVDEWKGLGRPYREFPRFVQRRFGGRLESFGFQELEYRDIRDVKVAGMGVYLYSLHLFSKSKVAIKFWRNALKGTSEQHSLGL